MATTTRQTDLFVAEDWTKIYQTFRDADFQSYDFQTLRQSMINYLRLYYPEDFNDFIDSSEFVALIDLIAFLGQSLAFRGDLNARENFIDTAQRRDSILKLARLINYYPKRNTPAVGFLKVVSVSTSEQIFDSNGLNLSGLVVNWNDSGNANWLEQFTAIVNGSLNAGQVIGKPSNSQTIAGILTQEYGVNLVAGVTPTYAFNASVGGVPTAFEVVSPTSQNSTTIYENPPIPTGSFNLLYKNDNLGNNSVNTGFFMYFKQGAMGYIDFNFSESLPNRIFSINTDNINNNDIWLYSLTNAGQLGTEWSQVPAINGTNIIYNTSTNMDMFQVNSRASDQIDLVFGDGSFASIPQGNFRLYYRVSSGLSYKITPDEITNTTVPINYVSSNGRVETLTIRASLQYTVANATTRETIEDIRKKAPQQYYTQNRMVNGEDYNILPYTLFSDVIKVKSVNRTASGISRYLDVIDVTGKYSSTNIFCDDGYLYREQTAHAFDFTYVTSNDITKMIYNQIAPILDLKEVLHFFYAYFPTIAGVDTIWNFSNNIPNGATGYFINSAGNILKVGYAVSNNNSYVTQGSIIKFYAGDGYHFDAQHNIIVGPTLNSGDSYYIYAQTTNIIGDGSNNGAGNLPNGFGPISLSCYVPSGATITSIFASFANKLQPSVITAMTNLMMSYKNFALRYDSEHYTWSIVDAANIGTGNFGLSNTGDNSGTGLDNSWIINFQTVGATYNIKYRGLNYVFQSNGETNFYYDNSTKIYDPVTGFVVQDQIKILKVNNSADSAAPLGLDYTWYVYNAVTEADGYQNPNKILLTFADTNNDGLPDNPELFDLIVNPTVNASDKYVYFLNSYSYDNFVIQNPVDKNTINSLYTTLRDLELNRELYSDGQIFYLTSDDSFFQLTITGLTQGINTPSYTLTMVTGYSATVGRQGMYFQYRHNSPNNRRIDPSPSNIMDIYILNQGYSDDYTAWIRDATNTVAQPLVPTSDDLALAYSSLENYKTIGDALVYNPAMFKPIFGAKATPNLQATFKVIKNPNVNISDNDVQTSVINAINTYFNIGNWDFGETFYFSELSAYLHSVLVPNISSIIIVPMNSSNVFGSLLQINANYNEIIVSCATVDNVQIISAITASQINQTGIFITT